MNTHKKLIDLRRLFEFDEEELSETAMALRRFRFQQRHLLKRARKFRRWAIPLSRRLAAAEASIRARAAMDENP